MCSDSKKNNLKVSFCTLGCRVNQYETEAIAAEFKKCGFDVGEFDEKCDVYVINTCTVTGESDRKSRQMIRRARAVGGEDAIVLAAGCYTQTHAKELEKIKELDMAVGSSNKLSLAKYALDIISKKSEISNDIRDIMAEKEIEEMNICGFVNTRVNVKIVDGCDNKCTYCIIPKARGHVRSKARHLILEEIENLAKAGYHEIILTGIETSEYGKDLEDETLQKLILDTDKINGVERIRLGSLEPTLIDRDFIDSIKNTEHFMPHYHLSLQSGSDRILNLMKRRYNTRQYYEKMTLLRENIPDVEFTTDIIVGFPGESEEDFKCTLDFVEKVRFLYAHIFPYSPRTGTPAAEMDCQLDTKTKKQRVKILYDKMIDVRRKILSGYIGRQMNILVEEIKDGVCIGHTENFIEVHKKGIYNIGEIIPVTLEEISENALYMYGK